MLTFFFVSKSNEPGGVQSLILNIGKAYNSIGKKIKLITTNDSFVYLAAIENKMDFEWIDSRKDYSQRLSKEDVFVCFGQFGRDLENLSNSSAKLIFWSVFPDDIINVFKIRISFKKNKFSNRNLLSYLLTRKLVNMLIAGNSAFFMDQIHISILQKYGLGQGLNSSHLLQIPVELPMPNNELTIYDQSTNNITLTYIGRAEYWKIIPFIKLLIDLNGLKKIFNFKVNVITDYSSKFLTEIDRQEIETSGIEIEYHIGLFGNKLNDFLTKNSHIVFTMGTSLLDAASLGIPTIIIDPYYEIPKESNIYRYIFEEKGFCLGRPSWIMKPEMGHTLKDIFNVLSNIEYYNNVSIKCREYVQTNHNIDIVIKKIIKAESNTTTRIKNLKKFNYFFKVKKKLYSLFRLI